MNPATLDLVVARLRDRVSDGDLLVRGFAEWLGVFDLGAGPVGPLGLWEPREVAVAGLRESRGRRAARPFAEGLRWLRSREYFRPHVPPVFEADPLAILAVALAAKTGGGEDAVAWIQSIASRAASAESDPWRVALLAAAAGDVPEMPELAVALGSATDAAIRAAAWEASLLLDDVAPERAAARLTVLTRAPTLVHRPPSPTAPTQEQASMKILFLAANPTTTNPLSLDEEMRAIEEKIRASDHRDQVEVVSKWAVRPDDLQLALIRQRPTIVHFSGHGAGAPGIVLHGDTPGVDRPVTGDALKHLFRTLPGNLRVVVLNACYSKDQAVAVSEVVDFVIGMNDSVDDEAARRFAASFYLGLASGLSVHVSFQLGINSVKLHGLPGDDIPELLVRDGASPGEVLIGEVQVASWVRGQDATSALRVRLLGEAYSAWMSQGAGSSWTDPSVHGGTRSYDFNAVCREARWLHDQGLIEARLSVGSALLTLTRAGRDFVEQHGLGRS